MKEELITVEGKDIMTKKLTNERVIYKDPIRELEMEFRLIPSEKLRVGAYQREESSSLANKILNSVCHGFIVPMIVVENGDAFDIIDGQHRFIAMATLRPQGWEVPCIVAPKKLTNLPLLLNIEKADTLKDRCTKIYKVYIDFFDKGVDSESPILEASLHQPHLLTLGFAYCEVGLASPSMVESLTKMFDSPIRTELSAAIEERRNRAKAIKGVEDTVVEIAKENGIKDYNLKRAILSTSKQAFGGASVLMMIHFNRDAPKSSCR